MKFINFFAGALVASAAANVLLASDAYASSLPNGWMQVGKSCTSPDQERAYTKLRKDSNQSMYGVYKNYEWDEKDITLAEANAKMNSINGCSGYWAYCLY